MSERAPQQCIRPIHEVDGLGWHPPGSVVLDNPNLGRVVHVAVCREDGTKIWDQLLHLEPVGAVTVPVNSRGEVGVVDVWRPTIPSAEQYRYPDLDLSQLGVMSTEFPRGLPKKGEAAMAAALREAQEELGSPIKKVAQIGEWTPNTTFHPHRIPVFIAWLDEACAADIVAKRSLSPPDVNEKILNVRWVSIAEFTRLVRERKIHCGATKSAFTDYIATVGELR